MFGKFLICLVISKAAAYSVCPYHVECIPGCIKLDEKGCKTCACGPMMFHPGAGYHGMPGGSMGGASFKPGQMGDGNLFGNLMGGGHQPAAKPTEKPLKECTGTMLCIMTCKGHYSLSDTVGSNGCRSCTCPKEHHETQTTVVVEKPKPKPQVVQQVVVAKPVTHPDCTGTKLCMMTCKGKYILGEHGKDGCQSCACVPEPEPAHVQVVQTKPKEECHETVICMLSCQHGYTISNPCNTGCQDKCQKCECKAPPKPQVIQVVEPPPKTIECPKAIECMSTCEHGYQLGHRGSDGCPQCNCLAPPKQQVIIYEVKCPQALSCSRGCSVGYRCDKNGCPTCGCIEPQVIGVTTIKEVYTTQAVTCQTALRCPKACNLGYKRGNDGCPVCECCQVINTGSGLGLGAGNSGNIQSSGSGSQYPGVGGSGVTSPFQSLGTSSQGYNASIDPCGPFGCLTNNKTGTITPVGGFGNNPGPQTNQGTNGSTNGLTSPFSINSQTGNGQFGTGPFSVAGNSGSNGYGGILSNTGQDGTGNSPFTINNNGNGAPSTGNGQGSLAAGTNKPILNVGQTGANLGSGPFGQSPLSQTGNGLGNRTVLGPFASSLGVSWQTGSSNGASWSTGGIGGPFSNGQGSGQTGGLFHNTDGNSLAQTGSNFAPSNNAGRPNATAPGTSNGGPFYLGSGTGGPARNNSGLPLSPYAVAGSGGGSPFSQAASGSGVGSSSQPYGGGSGPFHLQGATLGTDYGANPSHITDGSGGNIDLNTAGYGTGPFSIGSAATGAGSNLQDNLIGGSSIYSGTQTGQLLSGYANVHNDNHQSNYGSSSTGSVSDSSSSNLIERIKGCPDVLKCMTNCANGYNLDTDIQQGCPICTCVDGSSTDDLPGNLDIQQKVTSTQPVRPVQPQVTSGVTTLIKQCPATLQCMSTCSHGYTLGTEGRDGCPTCTCINPATSECHNTCEKKPAITVHSCDSVIHCMASCNNYHLGASGSDGCPVCTCADTCKTGCQETTHEIVQLVTSSGCQDRSCESTCTDCAKGQVVQVVSGASTSVGGGATGGGMATGGGALTRGGGGGMTGGGEQCPPLPPNCHPWCIKYDAAHCRLCQCESHSDSGYSG